MFINSNINQKLFENKSVLIDVANVLLSHPQAMVVFPKMQNEILQCNPIQVIGITDASLKHRLPIGEFIASKQIIETPAGTEADGFLLQEAQLVPNPVIITNDLYRDYAPEWLTGIKFVRFLIIRDHVLYNVNLKKTGATKKKKAPKEHNPEIRSDPISVIPISQSPSVPLLTETIPQTKNAESAEQYELIWKRITAKPGELNLFS